MARSPSKLMPSWRRCSSNRLLKVNAEKLFRLRISFGRCEAENDGSAFGSGYRSRRKSHQTSRNLVAGESPQRSECRARRGRAGIHNHRCAASHRCELGTLSFETFGACIWLASNTISTTGSWTHQKSWRSLHFGMHVVVKARQSKAPPTSRNLRPHEETPR